MSTMTEVKFKTISFLKYLLKWNDFLSIKNKHYTEHFYSFYLQQNCIV